MPETSPYPSTVPGNDRRAQRSLAPGLRHPRHGRRVRGRAPVSAPDTALPVAQMLPDLRPPPAVPAFPGCLCSLLPAAHPPPLSIKTHFTSKMEERAGEYEQKRVDGFVAMESME